VKYPQNDNNAMFLLLIAINLSAGGLAYLIYSLVELIS